MATETAKLPFIGYLPYAGHEVSNIHLTKADTRLVGGHGLAAGIATNPSGLLIHG